MFPLNDRTLIPAISVRPRLPTIPLTSTFEQNSSSLAIQVGTAKINPVLLQTVPHSALQLLPLPSRLNMPPRKHGVPLPLRCRLPTPATRTPPAPSLRKAMSVLWNSPDLAMVPKNIFEVTCMESLWNRETVPLPGPPVKSRTLSASLFMLRFRKTPPPAMLKPRDRVQSYIVLVLAGWLLSSRR